MKATPHSCPDRATLIHLCDGDLPKAERTEWMHHVSHCQNCRAALKELFLVKSKAQTTKSEREAEATGGQTPKAGVQQPVGEEANPTRTLPAGGTPHHSDVPETIGDDWRTYLAPSKTAGSLGKLGHYEVLKLIGRGGMGVVLKAFDEKLQRKVALKLLAPTLAGSSTARKRFVREARAAAAVRDSHIVNIYDVDETGPVPYLVMEYIAGTSLEARLKRGGAMGVKDILQVGIQIADGLAAAHKQGLVHRDIKPANILLQSDPTRVVITDFGLARAVDDANLTQSGVISGTPMFMAPEQALGNAVDHRADLFSLGSVLYAMCTGDSPFRATGSMAVIRRVCDEPHLPLRKVNPELPKWLCAIVDKLLAKNREERYGSAAVVADLLRRGAATAPERGRAAPDEGLAETLQAPVPERRHRKSRVPLYVGLGATAFLVLAGLVLVPALLWHRFFPSNSTAGNSGDAVVSVGSGSPGGIDNKPPALPPLLVPFKREAIPTRFLELAGGGSADRAPPDLVAVFGEDNWLLPFGAKGSWIDLSPDGQLLAIPSNDSVAILDAETGKWLTTLTGFRGRAYSVAFSPSGKQIAVGTLDGDNVIHLYEASNGRPLRTFPSSWPIYRLAFSPADSRLLAAVGASADKKEGGGAVWDVATGTKAYDLAGLAAATRNIVFSPTGAWLATASDDQKVRIFHGSTGRPLQDLNFLPQGLAYGLAVSSDGKLLAAGNYYQTMAWSTDKWNPVVEKPWDLSGECLAFKGQSHKLFAAAHENRAYRVVNNAPQAASLPYALLDLDTKSEMRDPISSAIGSHVVFRLNAKGDRVFFMTSNPQIVALRPARYVEADGRLGPTQGEVPDPVEGLAVSNDERWLAVFKKAGDGRIWDLKKGQLAVSLLNHAGVVNYAAFSPDGTRLATSSNGNLAIWNTRTGIKEHQLTGARKIASNVSFSPDGKILYSMGADGTPTRWDVSTGQMLTEPWGDGPKAATLVAASPTGKLVAICGPTNRVRVLRAQSGEVVHEFTVNANPTVLLFSRNGKILACSYRLKGATHQYLWEVPSGRPLPAPQEFVEGAGATAIHPTRRLLAYAMTDGSVRLVEMDGKVEKTHTFDPGPFGKAIKDLDFTPDGTCLAVGAENGTVMFMRVPDVFDKPTNAPRGELYAKDSSIPGWGTTMDPAGDCKVHSDGFSLTFTVPKGPPHLLGQPKQKLNAPRVLQPVQGDFTAEVRVNAFPPPLSSTASANSGGPFVSAGLLIWQDDQNFIRWERAVVDGTTIRLRMERILGGKSFYRQEWDIYDPATALLVERTGNKFTFKTKDTPAAAVWAERYFTTIALPPQLQVGVFAINNTTKDLVARLHAFNLRGTQLVAVTNTSWGPGIDPDRDCKFEEAKGQMTIFVPGTPHDLVPTSVPPRLNAPRTMQDVQGDFTLRVRVKALPKQGPDSSPKGGVPMVATGLLLWQRDQDFVRFELTARGGLGGQVVTAHRTLNGKASKALSQNVPVAEGDVYLQVSRSVNKLTFSIKDAANSDWRSLQTYTWAAPLKVGVHAINTTAKPFAAVLQDFSLAYFATQPSVVASPVTYTKGMVIPQSGTVVDPDGDCRFTYNPKGPVLTITVPKVPHDLTHATSTPRLNAPRVLQEVNGDFNALATINAFSPSFSKTPSVGPTSVIAAGLLIWQDDKNFLRLERAAIDGKPERLRLEQYEGGVKKLDKDFDSGGPLVSLQVERSGKQFIFRGGSINQPVGKILEIATLDLPAQLQVGPYAINTTAAEFSAQFQWLFVIFDAKAPKKAEAPPPGTFPPRAVPSAVDLAKKPAPSDALKRSDIAADLLATLGTANNDAPKELVAVLGKPGDPQVVSLALTADASRLAAGGWRGGQAQLFDLADGKLLQSFPTASTPVNIVGISADGSIFVMTGSTARSVQVFDTATGQHRTTLESVGSQVLETVFSPTAKLLAIGDNGGNLKLHDLASGTEKPFKLVVGAINRMAFSPDGKFLACSGQLGKEHPIVIIEVATGKMFGPLYGHATTVLGLAWHPNGQILAAADNAGSVRLWNLPTMTEAQPPLQSDGVAVHGLAWHPSGEFLASSSHIGGTITLWDMRDKTARRHQAITLFPSNADSKAVVGANNDLLFTPEGRYLIAGNSDGTIAVLRLAELGQVLK